jgi:hypothetical protein
MAKSWQEKFEAKKEPKIKVLESDFADIKKGESMLISTPQEIVEHINKIPAEKNADIAQLRKDLAKKHKADKTCPVTTGIFLRIIAERSLELMSEEKEPLAPFWKVIDPTSPLANKLSCGPELIAKLRSKHS